MAAEFPRMEEKTGILPFFVLQENGMERSSMIFTEQSPVYQRSMDGMDIITGKDRPGIVSGKSRWNSPSVDKNREDFFSHISRAAGKAQEEVEDKEETKNGS